MTGANEMLETVEAPGGTGRPRVYIVLVNWNGCLDTIECLESVFRLRYGNFRVVVCDNDSSDSSVGRIVAWAEGRTEYWPPQTPMGRFTDPPIGKPLEYRLIEPEHRQEFPRCDERLVLLPTGGNLGFAGGNNVGIRFALCQGDCDFVWLLNNDTVVDPDSLDHLIERARRDGSIGMIGATIHFYDRPDTVQDLGGSIFSKIRARSFHLGIGRPFPDLDEAGIRRVEEQLDWISGASLFVSETFVQNIGLMEERYFLYYEELDWAIRSRGRFGLGYAPQAMVYHKHGVSTGEGRKSETSIYFKHSSRLKLYRKLLPTHVIFCFFATATEALLSIAKGNVGALRPMWRALTEEIGAGNRQGGQGGKIP